MFFKIGVLKNFCNIHRETPVNACNFIKNWIWHSCFPVTSTKFLRKTFFKEHLRLGERAVVQRCSVKKVFLEISQNLQENTCARVSFFNEDAGLRPATLFKKRLWHRCFPVDFVKFLRTPFFIEHLWWLLLIMRFKLKLISHTFLIFNMDEATHKNIYFQ